MKFLRYTISLIALISVSCTSPQPDGYLSPSPAPAASRSDRAGTPAWDNLSHWSGGGSGKPRIEIDLSSQTASFYRDDQLVGISVASSGREGYNTPPGTFTITQKSPDHRSNLYGDYVDSQGRVVKENVDVREDKKPAGTTFLGAPMPKFMRFNKGIGMHAGYLPGYPASHGCVRLPPAMANHFYDNADIGTKVVVKK